MADSGSSTSPAEKYKKPISSFFSSPRLFTNFTSKGFHETEAMMSPTSILDSKSFYGFKNPFWSETNSPRTPGGETHKRYWNKSDSKGVGLGLVDALVDKKPGEITSKPESKLVLFGSQLKIQIPPLPPATLSPSESPKSGADFGIKTRTFEMGSSSGSGSLSPSPVGKSALNSSLETSSPPRVFRGCLSASEMELSEDYTRVISRGPNPRTTHIFDNCIIESSCFDIGCSASAKENGCLPDRTSYPSESFLSFCFHCKKNLGQGKDIYMFRGEKAFCSCECRYQGMLMEEEMNKLEADDLYGT